MIQQQILKRCFASIFDFLTVRNNDSAIFCRRLTSRHQLGLHGHGAVRLLVTDLNETHAATGDDRQSRMPAVCRNLIANFSRCLNAVQPLVSADLNFFTVYRNRCHAVTWS